MLKDGVILGNGDDSSHKIHFLVGGSHLLLHARKTQQWPAIASVLGSSPGTSFATV